MEVIQKELIIVGGGPAGYAAAIRAAHHGMDVALVEADKLGGACLNRGCIPTKALLESSRLFARVRSGAFGVKGDVQFFLDEVVGRKDQLVDKLNKGIGMLIQSNKVSYYNAIAAFTGEKTLKLSTGETLQGQKILLALGAAPVVPRSIEGIELAKTSDDVLAHRFGDYEKVVVIGGGVIGVELATFFSEIGSQVTILEGLPRILSPFSPDVTKYIGLALRRGGVKVTAGASVKKLVQQEQGIGVVYTEKEKENTVSADLVIVCVGRAPRKIEGLELCGAEFDRGILTNADGQTKNPDIYAVGDCVRGSIQLAHYATARAVSVVDALAGKPGHTNLTCVPGCVYTNPPVAHVGLSEEEAQAAGREVETGKFNLGGNGKSLIAGEERGYVKVIFDKGTEQLLGVELVAAEAPEMIGGFTTLVAMGAKRGDILRSIYPHPSVSEGFFEAVEDSLKQALHVIYK